MTAMAALAYDTLARPWGRWASQPFRLIVTPALTAVMSTVVLAGLRFEPLWFGRERKKETLAVMLLDHLNGILNYCRTKVPLGVVEAVNGNIKSLLRRGRGYQNLHYLLLKAQRMAATRTEFVVFKKAA